MRLENNSQIVIIGGGPAGASCAIALAQLAKKINLRLKIVIYEGKIFEVHPHYNQCLGILSPPIEEIFSQQMNLPFPYHLIQRKINGYVLHSRGNKITLEEKGEISLAVRRINFDSYLLKKAAELGAEIIHSRVTDIDFNGEKIMVYSESDYRKAELVIGAFGLDDGTIKIFERRTHYKPPHFLQTLVTKIHPNIDFMDKFGNFIHAYLPSLQQIEFGAIVPKWNHFSVVIAGQNIVSSNMDQFLALPAVKALFPTDFSPQTATLNYYKGKFPTKPADSFLGNRFIIIGDAAGLVRPFKGKGVNAAIISGIKIAQTIIEKGISQSSFLNYKEGIKEIFQDCFYGRIVRYLAVNSAKVGYLDEIIELAKNDAVLKRGLFDCVSAHRSFREIYKNTMSLNKTVKLLYAVVKGLIKKATAIK